MKGCLLCVLLTVTVVHGSENNPNCTSALEPALDVNQTTHSSPSDLLNIPSHGFKLWLYVIIVIVVIVIISLTILVTSMIYNKRVKLRHIYSTGMKHVSEYNIRSQEQELELSSSHFIPIQMGGLNDQRFTPVHVYEEIPPRSVDSNRHLAATGSFTNSRISEIPQYLEVEEDSTVVSSHENEPDSLIATTDQETVEKTITGDGAGLNDITTPEDVRGRSSALLVAPMSTIYNSQILIADPEIDQTHITTEGGVFHQNSSEDSESISQEIMIPTVIVDEVIASEEIGPGQDPLDSNKENTPEHASDLNHEFLLPSHQTLSDQDGSDNRVEDEDDTYDVPQKLVRIISSRANSPEVGQIDIDLKDPSTLFDDPSYVAGILINKHNPDEEVHTNDETEASQVDKQSVTSADDKHDSLLPTAQAKPNVHVDSNVLPCLENLIQDDLLDLDPDIAACISSDQ